MEFNIEDNATLVAHINDNGVKDYYPTYHISIDGDYIAYEFDKLNLTADDVRMIVSEAEDEISNAIAGIIKRRVVDVFKFNHEDGLRVSAELEMQKWVGDYAYSVDSCYFDCKLALDMLPFDKLPKSADGFANNEIGDYTYFNANIIGIAPDWDGPFEFYITDEDEYRRYYEARKAMEQ